MGLVFARFVSGSVGREAANKVDDDFGDNRA
jgi:hypothetical protein